MNIKEWQKLLDREKQEYIDCGANNRFSHDGHELARWFGVIISKFEGRILDIGCGVIPLPEYMKGSNAEWYGIDPIDIDVEREFNFTKGMAEKLPYKNEFFDAVIFATSLNHLCDVIAAEKETYRVLKKGGVVIIWTGLISEKRYKEWKANGGSCDSKHLWGFTESSIRKIFSRFIVENWIVNGTSNVIIFKK